MHLSSCATNLSSSTQPIFQTLGGHNLATVTAHPFDVTEKLSLYLLGNNFLPTKHSPKRTKLEFYTTYVGDVFPVSEEREPESLPYFKSESKSPVALFIKWGSLLQDGVLNIAFALRISRCQQVKSIQKSPSSLGRSLENNISTLSKLHYVI